MPAKPASPQQEAQAAMVRHQLIQIGQHHAEDETGQMGQRRVFKRPQPVSVAPAIRTRDPVRVEYHVQRAGNHGQRPDAGQLPEARPQPLRPLPPRSQGNSEYMKASAGIARPACSRRWRWTESSPAAVAASAHARPKHPVRMGTILRRHIRQLNSRLSR